MSPYATIAHATCDHLNDHTTPLRLMKNGDDSYTIVTTLGGYHYTTCTFYQDGVTLSLSDGPHPIGYEDPELVDHIQQTITRIRQEQYGHRQYRTGKAQ